MRILLALVAALAGVLVPLPHKASAAPPGCGTTGFAGFFDDAVPRLQREDKVPGAVVSVVSGGTTVFAKGYGLDPDRSLVRVASISKLFTWTAVMQQVQAGRLDLTADVNRYLTGFRIPATYPQPVTLLDLMDHTAGFEDFSIGTAARDLPPLRDYLASHMPARIRPPGLVSAYSNYGAALAGYIVANVSGEPYEQYVRRHILDPLGMAHSTAAQPVPASLAADLAPSYDADGKPIPFTIDPMAPDGSLSTTASDIAKFMVAQLSDGGPVLSPATTALMHERSFAADPRLGGYAHGFMDGTVNGHRVIEHDGGWEGFRSLLMLVPGCDLGLFVSFTGAGAENGAGAFLSAFADRFLPGSSTVDGPANPRAGAPVPGFYEPTRHNESTVEKVTNLLGPLRLTVGPDGTVHFGGKVYQPAGGGLYRTADGTGHLVFLDGRYVATDGPAYQLMAPSETLPVNLVVLLVFLLPTLACVALPFGRRRRTTGTWRAARWLAAGSAVAGLGFLVALTLTLLGNTDAFQYQVPVQFRLLLAVPVLALAAAVGAAGCTVAGWRGSGARIVARVHQVSLLAGLAALTWFLWQWNLIGWQFA